MIRRPHATTIPPGAVLIAHAACASKLVCKLILRDVVDKHGWSSLRIVSVDYTFVKLVTVKDGNVMVYLYVRNGAHLHTLPVDSEPYYVPGDEAEVLGPVCEDFFRSGEWTKFFMELVDIEGNPHFREVAYGD